MERLYFIDESVEHIEFKPSPKTEEEIKKLTLEENLSETKRSIYILSKGNPIQKTAVFMNLHKILLEPEAWQKLIPLINDDLFTQTDENQIEAARSLIKLIKNNNIDNNNNLNSILRICTTMLRIWNQQILDEWVIVFNELIKKIQLMEIQKDIYQLILYLSDSTQHATSKYIATRMIGFVAQNNEKIFSGPLFDRAWVLCQDSDSEIRKIMASEVLEKICFNVGSDITEGKLLEKILELIYDSDIQIRLYGIDLLINVLDLLSYECKKSRMVQIFIDLLLSINEEIYKKMSFQLGNIVYKLEGIITKTPSFMASIQNFYKEFGTHKLPEVRRNFIYNLPYLITVLEQKELFKNIYLKLFNDLEKDVRIQAFLSFYEICKYVGPEECRKIFKEPFELLFKEDEKLIMEKFLCNFSEFLFLFVEPTKNDEILTKRQKDAQNLKTQYLNSIMNMMIKITNSHNWRLELIFLANFEKCMGLFNIKDLNEKYLPYLVDLMKKGVCEVSNIARKSLVSFLRINYLKAKEIINMINEELYASPNYRFRLMFLDIFEHMSKLYSTQYLKQNNILQNCMNLANDKNKCIKRRFIKIIPCLQKVILYDDNENLKKLDDIISKLIQDQDQQISQSMVMLKKELDNLPLESPAKIEFEQKRRIDEEEILKLMEMKKLHDEIEDQKKNKGEENTTIIKIDYLQNISTTEKFLTTKNSKKTTKDQLSYKVTHGLKAVNTSLYNTNNKTSPLVNTRIKVTSSIHSTALAKSELLSSLASKAINKMSINISMLPTNDLSLKKDSSLINNANEIIYAKVSSSAEFDKIDKEKKSILIKPIISQDSNIKSKMIANDQRINSSLSKSTQFFKNKEVKEPIGLTKIQFKKK